ncbi:hypothetical protein JIN84_16870 [Luteolibacter yonseiensis]|uniref:Uncharacterized protein n=1 Tax=Luteolibacter yonseiensis TaxID=1144680 RepID=A0A934VCM2_9BACT|nr:hypothetical protein [Luteolibacter yonseiensis]MBK1817295.1 hypothetical protein [Luteolibacter yonseiensis]
MNAILNFCCVLSVVCLLSMIAGNSGGDSVTTVDAKPSETVNRPTALRAVLFNSHARTKAVQYFDTYRTEPYGLPPSCVATRNPMELPMDKIHIRTGEVVRENERACLLDAPDELTRMFPVQPEGVRYCVAGNQLVVVDDKCRVLDAIRIPTIRPSVAEEAQTVKLASHQF